MTVSTAIAQFNDYDDDISLQTFYEELSPYCVWIDDPQYGLVWRPDVDQDEFRPYYTRGHWEMTKYGNTWVSDYDWGWAPFHYGRWHHHSRRGWVWIPGRKWAPAWVSWRSGGGHYGWAPLGPGMNINIGRKPNFWWVFVPHRNIYYRSYSRYDWRRNTNIYHNTVIINNVYVNNSSWTKYYCGPRADEIRKVTRQPVIINPVRSQRPSYANGPNNRPEVSRGSVPTPRPIRPTDAGRGGFNSGTDNSIVDRPDNSNRGAVSGRSVPPVTDRPNTTTERGAVTSRPDRVTTTRPGEPVSNRPGEQKIPPSSQRSSRTYDNQDMGGSESAQRERQKVVERQPRQSNQPSAPQREQRAEPRPAQEQRAEPRPQQQERPQPQREANRDNSRQESPSSSSPEQSSERSNGGRPSRGN